jgi:hypothetical protein
VQHADEVSALVLEHLSGAEQGVGYGGG